MTERESRKIDKDQLKSLMRLKPTLEDTAAFFECNVSTITRFIRDNYESTFAQFRDENMVHTRLALVREAIKQAQSGNTAMLIFCLKNVCGWADKVDVAGDQVIQLKYSLNKKPKVEGEVIDIGPVDKEKESGPGKG